MSGEGIGIGDEDDTATQEQQHARRRNTYHEHPLHVRHRAHVPITDGLIEGLGKLHRSEGRAAVWSERRSRSERMRDGRRRHGDARAAATRGWRNTYPEHAVHVRHRARVPARQVWVERCRVRNLRATSLTEQLSQVRHTRRARPGELNFVRGSGSNQRIQSSPIALGVQDAVHLTSVAHCSLGTEHGDAVVGEVKQLQRWPIIVR